MPPQIPRFADTARPGQIAAALQSHGCAIVERVLCPAYLDDLREQSEPHLHPDTVAHDNAFMGSRTQRFGRVIERVASSRGLVQHGLILQVFDATLGQWWPTYQVHFTGVIRNQEGALAQALHRDADLFRTPCPPLVIGAMWALDTFTQENGATVLAPGSHSWNHDCSPLRRNLVAAEMPAGSVLLYDGHVIHGGGRCDVGQRTGMLFQYSPGWLRQEENQYLAVPTTVARGLAPNLQRLLGYDLAARHWGYVDQQHPQSHLTNANPLPGNLAPDGYDPDYFPALRMYATGGERGRGWWDMTLDD